MINVGKDFNKTTEFVWKPPNVLDISLCTTDIPPYSLWYSPGVFMFPSNVATHHARWLE